MTTRRAVLTSIGTAGVTLSGCTGRVTNTNSGTSAALLLNWKPSGLHVPYFAADAQGFYEDEGINVTEIKAGQGSDFSATQAGLGNVEFAITSSDQVLNVAAEEGVSVHCVAVVTQQGPVQVFTARDQFDDALTGPDQLEGKTIGSGPGMVRQMVRAYLEHHGLLDGVTYVDSGFDTVQQLLSGEIDAAGGVFSDAVDARLQGATIDALSVHNTIPSYGHVIATSESYAEANPKVVQSFLQATARGAVWSSRRPGEAINHLLETVPELSGTRQNQRAKWDTLRQEFMLSETVRKRGWGYSNPGPWKSIHRVLADGDFPGGDTHPAEAWTNEYLNEGSEFITDFAERFDET